MYDLKSTLPPKVTLSLFHSTHCIGVHFGSWGTRLERIAVRAVVTIQQFWAHAFTLPIVSRARSLLMISSQLCFSIFPRGRSERTLQAHTSDHGSMNAKSLPAVHGISRSWPRIFSI